MKILIVSSDSDSSSTLKKILASRLGYKDVQAVSKGADGILAIKDKTYMDSAGVLFGKKPVKACDFKLLVIDEDIPDIPVLVFVQAVRKLFGKAKLPVMLMTLGDDKENLMSALKAGANNFVLKPLRGEIVKTKVSELVPAEGGSVVTSATNFFQKGTLKTKGYSGSSTLKRMASGGKTRGGGAPVGAYYTAGKKTEENDEDTQIADDGSLINGHYHEEVDVVGGGTNCVWGREKSGSGQVVLEYVSPKGKASGIHVKTITREEFLKNYKVCTPQSCDIMKRVEREKEEKS